MGIRPVSMEDLVMSILKVDSNFWSGKTVFLTGHTGFKGGWLAFWLTSMGAKVTGYALAPDGDPSLFEVLDLRSCLAASNIADIRDLDNLKAKLLEAQPEIVIHMAAQPLVRLSYSQPVETYATNVMGTVHLLESLRGLDSVRATIIVTTDKCYENQEWVWGYRESEPMGGRDPYSNSKGCAELVTSAYRESFFPPTKYHIHRHAIASARAGNVIGGGDWSGDRLIPDAIKAFNAKEELNIRNPFATRPWQHVLEPLSGYLLLAQALYEKGAQYGGGWNFGPRDEDACSVRTVIEILIDYWGESAKWTYDLSENPHEANALKLDISKARHYLGWTPKWELHTAIQKIVEWHHAFGRQEDMRELCLKQIQSYNLSE